jgi:hypothetical protein
MHLLKNNNNNNNRQAITGYSMASLSKSEIIKKHPIGGGLDTFHDSFSSTYAELVSIQPRK